MAERMRKGRNVRVIECMGPTNTRIYTVAVYFKGQRLAKASGHSIQQAEMNAAKKALSNSKDLFPQLDHQKRVISKSMHCQKNGNSRSCSPSNRKSDKSCKRETSTNKSNLPIAYQRRNRSKSPEQKSSVKKQGGNTESRKSKANTSITKTNSDLSLSSVEKLTDGPQTKQITDKAEEQIDNKTSQRLKKCKGRGVSDDSCRDWANNKSRAGTVKVNTRLTSNTESIGSISIDNDSGGMETWYNSSTRQTSVNGSKHREVEKGNYAFCSTIVNSNSESGQKVISTPNCLTRDRFNRNARKKLSVENFHLDESNLATRSDGNQPRSQSRSKSRNFNRDRSRSNERHKTRNNSDEMKLSRIPYVPCENRTKGSRSRERIHPLDFLLGAKDHCPDHRTDTPGLLMDLMFSKNTPPQPTSKKSHDLSNGFHGSSYGDNHSLSQSYDSQLNFIAPSFSRSQSGHYENTSAFSSNSPEIGPPDNCQKNMMYPHSGPSIDHHLL